MSRVTRPDHPVANLLEGAGAILIFFGLLPGAFALLMSWLEFGRWTEVLTWFAAGVGAAFALGIGFTWIGQNWNRRCLARWNDRMGAGD